MLYGSTPNSKPTTGFGFGKKTVVSEAYEEAGISHRTMRRVL
jgi:hypothetical protein